MTTPQALEWTDALALALLALASLLGGAYASGLVSASRSRIKKLVEKKSPPAASFLAKAASNDPAVPLRADLLYAVASGGFVIVGLNALSFPVRTSETVFTGVEIALLVFLLLLRAAASLLGEHYAERLVVAAAGPVALLTLPLYPVALLALRCRRVFARAAGVDEEDEEEEREAEVIDAVSDGQLDGVVEAGQRQMIEGIFELKDADVADIFVPRTAMTTINADSSLQEAVKIANSTGYSRLPCFRGNRDHIVGVFHIRDALAHWDKPENEQPTLESLLRAPLFVPETKKVSDLLPEMRRGGSHMAVVLDEYGGTAGLVTIEDVLEEIVGEIRDEFDNELDAGEGEIKRLDENTLIVEGYTHVADVNKLLESEIIPEDDDYETVAGFVLDKLGHIPAAGEKFVHAGVIQVKVLSADERRVKRVRLRRLDEAEPES